MDHPLENLGHERFQQLCQALLAKEFPGISCFPVGQPDGGRDAMRMSPDAAQSRFAVYQVKFSRNLMDGKDNREWVLASADGEAEKVRRLVERGAEHYYFITNVAGSSHLDTGSIDRLHHEMAQKFGVAVSGWWRDDINRRLDGNWDIKLRYPEILNGQDFLRLVLDSNASQENDRRHRAVNAFLSDQYHDDEEVKFKQVDLHNKLLDIFVDLPFTVEVVSNSVINDFPFDQTECNFKIERRGGDASVMISDSSDDQRESGTATMLLCQQAALLLPQVIVEGAPGQGKSTLAQYICQVNRIRLLNKSADLLQLPLDHRNSPICIPFKIDLRDFASWLNGNDPFSTTENTSSLPDTLSLETFLIKLVVYHSGGIRFELDDLIIISKIFPMLIVLDGLDEVADIKQRNEVVSSVTRSVNRLRENCPRMRVVITSRPAVFANSPGFDRRHFPHLQLGSVKRSQIHAYAGKWMEVRNISKKERISFEFILNEKLSEPHIADLARNPMQLAILLNLIRILGSALPDKRTSMYDEYIGLFFARESEKNPVVAKHMVLLKDIHRYLAWVLHVAAESSRKASAGRITQSDLRETVRRYLVSEQYDTSVIDDVFDATLERIFMIVSRVQGTYEFEVQPLREYFAARFLYDTASYSPTGRQKTGTKPDRFDAIAQNFYWANVVRFFGGCFTKGELLDLADHVKVLMENPILGRTRQPSALAAMLLSDWVFEQSPKAVTELTNALKNPDVLRRLLPADPYRHHHQDFILIPLACGGLNVCKAVFDRLCDPTTPAELSNRLATYLNRSLSRAETTKWWVTQAPRSASQRDIEHWAFVGELLGALQAADLDHVVRLVGDAAPSYALLRSLVEAGRYDYLITSDAMSSASIDFLFSQAWMSDLEKPVAPFFLLPFLLSVRFRWYRNGLFPRPSHLGLDDVGQDLHNSIETDETPVGMFSKQAHAISVEFLRRIADAGGALDLSMVESAVEKCWETWGNQISIIGAANSIVARSRGAPGRRAKVGMFASRIPLCDRIRFAKSPKRDADWWRHQLSEIGGAEDRFLFHMIFWKWARTEFAIRLHGELAADLALLPRPAWEKLLNAVAAESGRPYSADPQAQPLPKEIKDTRMVIMLGVREPKFGYTAFVETKLGDHADSLVVSEYRIMYAVFGASISLLSWMKALDIIKQEYAHSKSRDHWMYYISPLAMPEDAVSRILSNADDYPLALWERAISLASVSAQKAVQRVGAIAKSERWFK
jgi:hypothetical protein